MEMTQIHQGNRAWWNENADWYAERDADTEIAFLKAGGNYLFPTEQALLGNLSPWCRRAVHLQCSHGRDGLSLLAQGAAEVVGVDISERLLAVATHKTQALSARATWVLGDILDTPHDLDGTADLVYTGKGALCWMMDLAAWAEVVARLLAPGGLFFIYEGHPLDWVWDLEASGYQLDAQHGDYFSAQGQDRLFSQQTQAKPYYRQWTLGEIVTALCSAGLRVERLEEFPEPFWDQFPNLPTATLHCLPHAFALTARKH